MKKIENEYNELYGKISKDNLTRVQNFLSETKFNNKNRSLIFTMINKILNIKFKRVDFTIYLVPKATPRPRHNIKKNTFYVVGAKDNKDIFKYFISNHNLELITTPCKFYCTSYLPIPKSMNNVEKLLAELGLIRPISKPDWDNVGKTYSDMIQGMLLFDDSLIIEGVSKKFYSLKPRIEISIEYMEEFDSIYNEKKLERR